MTGIELALLVDPIKQPIGRIGVILRDVKPELDPRVSAAEVRNT